MELHHLTPAPHATKARKRIGRGQGSGKGGTATQGHKGAQSRSGYKTRPHFAGGQTPLQRRVPKSGFQRSDKLIHKPINLDTLQQLAQKAQTATIDPALLRQHGLLSKHQRYKVLAGGTLTDKLSVTAHACSAAAKEAIEKCAGSLTLL